jgi:hypothetical protein
MMHTGPPNVCDSRFTAAAAHRAGRAVPDAAKVAQMHRRMQARMMAADPVQDPVPDIVIGLARVCVEDADALPP